MPAASLLPTKQGESYYMDHVALSTNQRRHNTSYLRNPFFNIFVFEKKINPNGPVSCPSPVASKPPPIPPKGRYSSRSETQPIIKKTQMCKSLCSSTLLVVACFSLPIAASFPPWSNPTLPLPFPVAAKGASDTTASATTTTTGNVILKLNKALAKTPYGVLKESVNEVRWQSPFPRTSESSSTRLLVVLAGTRHRVEMVLPYHTNLVAVETRGRGYPRPR